jgi:hypothetical protein
MTKTRSEKIAEVWKEYHEKTAPARKERDAKLAKKEG